MIKSKKLFARALYLVFALALVAGLTLVPAIIADSPADTDVGFEFGVSDITGTPGTDADSAEWADNSGLTASLPTAGLGNYSVKLIKGDVSGSTHVKFFPDGGLTLDDLATLSDTSYWYYAQTATSPWVMFELRFADPDSDGYVEVSDQIVSPGALTWTERDLAASSRLQFYGNSPEDNEFGYYVADLSADAILTEIDTQINDADTTTNYSATGWVLDRVRAELYDGKDAGNYCYFDDVTIDGTVYELEPIFLDAEYYSVGDTVEVTVPNFAANTDSIRVNPTTAEEDGDGDFGAANWTAIATSDSDSGGITVYLEETGANTGVFTGEFTTTDTLPAAEDEVYVEDSDTIKVTYVKENDWGTGEPQSADLTITVDVDDTAPEITDVFPEDTIDNRTPDIGATYTGGVDTDSVEIIFDGVDVTEEDATSVGNTDVTYTPEDDLADGTYEVTVNIEDDAGNAATETWSFSIASWLEGSPVEDTVVDGACLDELDTIGVEVCIFGGGGNITVGRYASNPEPDAPPTFTMIENGFFDVRVTGAPDATQVVIKFADANITAESTAHVWDDLQGMWLACSDLGYNPTDEFLWVKVREADTTPNISELGGTPFAISGVSEVTKGDFDGDGDIDLVDFVQFATAYGSELGDDNYNAIGDFNDDGEIGLLDFVQFATVYGT